MSDAQDSWFGDAFGVDLGEAADKLKEGASAALGQVTGIVSSAVQTVESAVEGVSSAAGGVEILNRAPACLAPQAVGQARSRSVGPWVATQRTRRTTCAIQAVLGLSADGQCGPQTIGAIEGFQRKLGQAKPDGRVDAGGATERAMAGNAKSQSPAPDPASEDASPRLLIQPNPGRRAPRARSGRFRGRSAGKPRVKPGVALTIANFILRNRGTNRKHLLQFFGFGGDFGIALPASVSFPSATEFEPTVPRGGGIQRWWGDPSSERGVGIGFGVGDAQLHVSTIPAQIDIGGLQFSFGVEASFVGGDMEDHRRVDLRGHEAPKDAGGLRQLHVGLLEPAARQISDLRLTARGTPP